MHASWISGLVCGLVIALAPGAVAAEAEAPSAVLSAAQIESHYPDLGRSSTGVLPGGVFAPRAKGCHEQHTFFNPPGSKNRYVRPRARKNSALGIDQFVMRFPSKRKAERLVRRYARFGRRCAGDHERSFGPGSPVTLRIRAWHPRRLGGSSAGYLSGAFEKGSAARWTRHPAVRVGRSVSVLEVVYSDVKPPARNQVALARAAVRLLG